MSEVGRVNRSLLLGPPAYRVRGPASDAPTDHTQVRNGAKALHSLLQFRAANMNESMDPRRRSESEPETRNGAEALTSLLQFREANKNESMDPRRRSEPESETRNGAEALTSLLQFREANKNESMDPRRRSEPEPETRNGAEALDSLLQFRNANMDESMDPSRAEPEPEVRNAATALESLLEHRRDIHRQAMGPGGAEEPEPEVRNAATALDTILEMLTEQKRKAMQPDHHSEPEHKIRNAATALATALHSLDTEVGTFGRNKKGRRVSLDPTLEEDAQRAHQFYDGNAAHAVSVVQDFSETARHIEERLARLEQFVNRALTEAPSEGRAAPHFRAEMREMVDAINLETTHAPLLGQGGADIKIPNGDGSVAVLTAQNFSMSLDEAMNPDGMESLLDSVRDRLSAIRVFRRRLEDQVKSLAQSGNDQVASLARDMGVNASELNPETAAELTAQVAGHMMSMTAAMVNLDLDHQAKRIAGLLRNPQ